MTNVIPLRKPNALDRFYQRILARELMAVLAAFVEANFPDKMKVR
jgi:hypothetical protein